MGEATFRMSLEADGSADFNGVGGTWAYADGKLIIGGLGGTAHEFLATVDGSALTLAIEGMQHPLILERVAPSVAGGSTAEHGSVAGLIGEWEGARGEEIAFRPDGVLLHAGEAMRYRAGKLWLSFLHEGGELRLPYELSADRLVLGSGETRQELRRKGAPAASNAAIADEASGLQHRDYTEEDAKRLEETLSGLSPEERRQGLKVGLVTYGYVAYRSLFLLAQKLPSSAILQQHCVEAAALSISWLSGERLTDRADEDERRALVALDILKIGGEDCGLHRLAARSIMSLPEGHPLRDVEAARDALLKQLDFCFKRKFWGGWISTVASLIEYDFLNEEAVSAFVMIAEGILERDPHDIFGEQVRLGEENFLKSAVEAVHSVHPHPNEMLIELRKEFRGVLLKHYGERAVRARDAGDETAFRESLEKAEAQVQLLSANNGESSPTDTLDLMGLVKDLANKPREAVELYARALASGKLGPFAAQNTAQREASLRVTTSDFQRAIDLLQPILSSLEAEYLAEVEDNAVQSAGGAFCKAAEDLAFSYAATDRWGEALTTLDRAKSLRLRHRAGLRETEAGAAIVGVERALYASSRGAAAGGLPNGASEKDPIGRELSQLTRTLELYRQARQVTTSDLLSSPTVAAIAGALHSDEACAILGVHHVGMMLAVIFPGNMEEPSAHRILSDLTWTQLFRTMSEGENGWLYLNAFPIMAKATHREAVRDMIPRLDQALGAPLAEMLEGRGVRRLTIIPHHFLHLAPFWVLPSLSSYQVTVVPSAAHLMRSRTPRPATTRSTLAVIDPTLDLPMSPAEAHAMEHHLAPSGWVARRLARADAREEKVVEALRGAAILHFSGHGQSDGLHPTKSCLLLYPDLDRFAALGVDPLETLASKVEKWEHDPWQGIHASFPGLGRLYQIGYTEADVKEWTLEYSETGTLWHRYHGTALTHRAELWRAGDIMVQGAFAECRLAFLSSCHSGGAWNVRSHDIDEFAGLPAALLLAGVGSVVASLWPVDDVTTALYADKFYAVLAESDSVVDLAAVAYDTATYLRDLTRERAARCLADLRKRTTDPKARFRLEAATDRIASGAEMPFASPYDWGAFYVTGASEIDFGRGEAHEQAR